ncbi:hypothetical protein [Chryseobacterium indoltheticum]|uniref:Uncharacterized protein n=1 Tax=Chryseobacterium indoltheticum TaxID=254 RepID=A0A381FAF4_9FLAO|nr:hypothetical protein [Chryseobacterium indoltheticum]AZA73535.1 hypothetical protein EG358_07100 [Chryseobacterium indoltheticum]SIR25292.1 hypothetical protein SAMN05421682_115128 [Chryseobacterium indoltheticum]SUX43444.1 Uncharacterised protein [Chryseobacterium indoltheticum]
MQSTKIKKRLKVKDTVYRKILDDFGLRDKLIEITGLRESGVLAFAYRKSERAVRDFEVMQAIKEHTGWTDKEIFEEEK